MKKATLIPGDGIGPEVSRAMTDIISASGAAIEWEVLDAGLSAVEKYGDPLPEQVIESLRRNKVGIKGPIVTPVGKGFRSVNIGLRQALQLYVNVRHLKNLKGIYSTAFRIRYIFYRDNSPNL